MHPHPPQNTSPTSVIVIEEEESQQPYPFHDSLLSKHPGLPHAPEITSAVSCSAESASTPRCKNSKKIPFLPTESFGSRFEKMKKRRRVRFQEEVLVSGPDTGRSLPSTVPHLELRQEGDNETTDLWYAKKDFRNFLSLSKQEIRRFRSLRRSSVEKAQQEALKIDTNQDWINGLCDDLGVLQSPSQAQQARTRHGKPLTLKQLLSKYQLPSSSSDDDVEEFDTIRALLFHMFPLNQHRKLHVRRLLKIQKRLKMMSNKSVSGTGAGPPPSLLPRKPIVATKVSLSESTTPATTANESILRLTSIQTSRSSKTLARWLAHYDAMQVMSIVREDFTAY